MKLLDLFSGRFGWSKAFAARGWECVGVDLVAPPEIPENCTFVQADILELQWYPDYGFVIYRGLDGHQILGHFDFICASSPCEQFSVYGMKHFHPNPPYPELGLRLFNHTRAICEASGVPYVMENVRSAQKFVGDAVHHCGPFYLWGNSVPPLLTTGVSKGIKIGNGKITHGMTKDEKREYRKHNPWTQAGSSSKARQGMTATAATIPPELSTAVADYAEAILGVKNERI
jgi:hypothetical protein